MKRREKYWSKRKEKKRFEAMARDLGQCASAVIREIASDGLGFNTTWSDDDARILTALAQRAVLAGLASDAQPDMQRRMLAASEPHRADHERALGFPLTTPTQTSEKDNG